MDRMMSFKSALQPIWHRFPSSEVLCAPFTSSALAYYVTVVYGEALIKDEQLTLVNQGDFFQLDARLKKLHARVASVSNPCLLCSGLSINIGFQAF
jgi:hypothetical protein